MPAGSPIHSHTGPSASATICSGKLTTIAPSSTPKASRAFAGPPPDDIANGLLDAGNAYAARTETGNTNPSPTPYDASSRPNVLGIRPGWPASTPTTMDTVTSSGSV